MPSLKIDDGTVRLDIERDGAVVGQLVFNPKDELFAEKFYNLIGDFHVKMDEFSKRAKKVESNTEMDNIGEDVQIPANMPERFALTKEICEYIYGKIDEVFGQGTSHIVFGDAMVLEAILQFFDGIGSHVKDTRTEKISKYIPKVQKPKRSRRK